MPHQFTIPTGSAATLSDPTVVTPTFTADKHGTDVAQLKVNDGTVDSAPDAATIVTENSAPVADAGPDREVLLGGTVTLDGSASSDADGDPLSFQWSLITVPEGSTAVLSDPTAPLPTFVADLAGAYVARHIVNDGAADSAPDTVTIAAESSAPVEGVLLPGDPGSPAREAITTFILSGGVPLSEFSLDDAGVEVARTEIEVGFTSDATVGEVNALLESIGGRIASMLQGVLIVVVRVPDPGSLPALDTLIAGVESSSIVRFVNKSRLPAPDELPGNHLAGSVDLNKIDHHLSVRAAAAWNARAALDAAGAQRPLMVVADFFGDGPPNADVDAALAPSSQFGFGKPTRHGYHVLGIMSADYGGNSSARGLATGMFPDTLDVGIVDLVVNATDVLTAALMQNLILAFVQFAHARVGSVMSRYEPAPGHSGKKTLRRRAPRI